MEKIKLKDTKYPYFASAWSLYKDAFPLNERRSLNNQISIMSHPNYHFELIFQDNCFPGILFWWDLMICVTLSISQLCPITEVKDMEKTF